MKEIWKDIEGYEDSHQISNLGRVKSKEREVSNGNGNTRIVKERILATHDNGNGYKSTSLGNCSKGVNNRRYIHRLVAEHFLDNTDNLPQVNHINFDRSCNVVSNLEWISVGDNHKHSNDAGRYRDGQEESMLAVCQFDIKSLKLIETYPCASIAAEAAGCRKRHIASICMGRSIQSNGYLWCYEKDYIDNDYNFSFKGFRKHIVKVTNIKTGEISHFVGRQEASRYIGRGDTYITTMINSKNRFSNDEYKWEDVKNG